MLELTVSGTPYEIGYGHGQHAALLVAGSLAFYQDKFQRACGLNWSEVQKLALQFEAPIRQRWPAYLEEMRGIGDGADRPLADILALNVRTELAFGQFSDGCTAVGWRPPQGDRGSWLAQNWDASKPTIKMVTEAGIIGKIGLNDAGVGVCLNAIRTKGMDPFKLPCHLALRLVLESPTRAVAVDSLLKSGVASSCHTLIGDATGSTGVEWSAVDGVCLEPDSNGRVLHTNHYLRQHAGGDISDTWPAIIHDSEFRLGRVGQLLNEMADNPSGEGFHAVLSDTTNYPRSICRGPEDSVGSTLFSIIMDLSHRRATVRLGLPTQPDGHYKLAF